MDERGLSNTPKSLSTKSRSPSETNTTSESSVNTSERPESRHLPVFTATQDPGIETRAINGKGKEHAPTTDATVISPKTSNVIFMRPRYSRRVQSKSEPSHTSPAVDSVHDGEPPANRVDEAKPSEQRRVSAPMAQGSSASSMIPKPGNRGSSVVRQLPIPPRNSSDGKCGVFTTPAPKENAERRLERIPVPIKDTKEATNVAIITARNENQPPPKTGENHSTIAASSRGTRSIRRLRAGSLRGRRGRISRRASLQKNSQE
ncbi:heavy metal tolerance [Trichoderma arundinaceum]|uniref:Heavy metal tolerance n=1 Tax=Trichoderma arundinaceum TaxID=490622 RepID=A0A395NCH5_TRIAR|nr:heavy metal tolerance [Trichoderma arundinaceum]